MYLGWIMDRLFPALVAVHVSLSAAVFPLEVVVEQLEIVLVFDDALEPDRTKQNHE